VEGTSSDGRDTTRLRALFAPSTRSDGTAHVDFCTMPKGRLGSRLCENARDWRPDRVRSDTGEDFADRHGKISRIEPREHLMILRSSARG